MDEDAIRQIVREEIALWWTGGRTDSLYVLQQEGEVSAREYARAKEEQTRPDPDDGPLVSQIKGILRGDT